jgi:uncharacterized repeat protein (TIGR01451 family)
MLQPGLEEEVKVRDPGSDPEPDERLERVLAEVRGRRYRDLARDTQFTDAWVIVGLILTLIGLAMANPFLLGAAVAMFSVAAAGWGWNQLSLYGLHYGRKLSETRAFLGETITLTLEVRNLKLLPVTWLQVLDILPSALPMDDQQVLVNGATNLGEFTTFWSLGSFGRLRRRFTVHCDQRGYHTYGPATVTTGDAFGMFNHRGTLPDQVRLIIYPRLYSASELGLPAKNPFGERAAEARLVEDPLRTAGIRAWQPADDMKRVHWKATARHQQMLSRLYEPSQEPQVLVFLNVATLTRHWLGQIPELMERAISVAGSLAALCSEMRLPVGLIANGFLPGSDQPLRLLPGRSPDQLLHILELLAAVTAFATQPIEDLLLRESPRLPWGSTLLVVTAVAHEELLAALLDLQRSGRKVVLFTLAERPPERDLPGILVYHLPHLVDDLIAPSLVQGTEIARPAWVAPRSRASESSSGARDLGSARAAEGRMGGKVVT